MKKSQLIALVLITSALASCNKKSDDWSTDKRTDNKKVYMRSDTTAPYAHTQRHHGGSGLLWFYAFRSFGHYNNGHFARSGYYSSGLGSRANLGNNSSKSSVVRGGFGHSSSHVSS